MEKENEVGPRDPQINSLPPEFYPTRDELLEAAKRAVAGYNSYLASGRSFDGGGNPVTVIRDGDDFIPSMEKLTAIVKIVADIPLSRDRLKQIVDFTKAEPSSNNLLELACLQYRSALEWAMELAAVRQGVSVTDLIGGPAICAMSTPASEALQEFEAGEALLRLLKTKRATWKRLCDCSDEFGNNSPGACEVYQEADDAAWVAIQSMVFGIGQEEL